MSALTHEDQCGKVIRLLHKLQESRFFGKLELDIQGGNVLRMIKHESIKLEEVQHGEQGSSETRSEGGQAEVPPTPQEQTCQAREERQGSSQSS